MDLNKYSQRELIQSLEKVERENERLRKRKNLLESAFDALPAFAHLKDRSGKYFLVNSRFEDFLGKDREDIIGKSIKEIIEDDNVAKIIENDGKAFESEIPVEFEEDLQVDGEIRHFVSAKSKCDIPEVDGGAVAGVTIEITERKNYEQALPESERKFRLLAEANPYIVFFADATGKTVYYNPAAMEYFGLTEKDMENLDWTKLVHPEDKDLSAEVWNKSQRTKKAAYVEYRLRRYDGKYFLHRAAAVPELDDEGNIVGWFGTAVNIHEAMTAAEEIAKREKNLAALAESGKNMVYVYDREGTITYAIGTEKYGVPRDAAVGANISDFFSDEKLEAFRGQIDEVFRTGKVITYENRMNWGGEDLVFFEQIYPIKSGGEVTSVGKICADITDLKKAEKALAESERRYRTLVSRAPVAIFIFAEGRYLFANPFAAEMLGCASVEEVLEIDPMDSFTPKTRKLLADRVSKLDDKKANDPIELEIQKKNGEIIFSESISIPIDFQGKSAAMIIGRDITRQKLAAEQMKTHVKSLEMINELTDVFLKTDSVDSILKTLCDRLQEMHPKAFIAVTYFDPKFNSIVLKKLSGFGTFIDMLVRILGSDPRMGDYDINNWNEENRNKYLSGKLIAIPDLHTLLVDRYPETVCNYAQKVMGVQKIYAAGITLNRQPKGGLMIFLKKGQTIANPDAIETLARQAAIMISRIESSNILSENEAKYRTLFEQSSRAIFLHNEHGKIIDVNRRACSQSGYSKDELLKMGVADIDPHVVPRKDREVFWPNLPVTFQTEHKKKSGEVFPVKVSLSEIKIGGQKRIMALAKDVTEQMILERQRLANESRLKALVELSKMTYSPEEEIYRYALDKAVELTESDSGFIASVETESLLKIEAWYFTRHYAAKPEVKEPGGVWDISGVEPLKRIIGSKESAIINDASRMSRFEEFFPLDHIKIDKFLCVPVVESGKTRALFLAANKKDDYDSTDANQLALLADGMMNILRRREYERELLAAKEKAEKSDKLKSAFLANMSHEIRTPLNPIFGFSQMLREDDVSSEDRKEYAGIIYNRCEQLLAIINDVIDLSKIEAGHVDVNPEETSLNMIIRRALKSHEPIVETQGLEIKSSCELDENDCLAVLDPIRLEQVLINLVNNAVKFTDEGEVEFGYKIDEDKIKFFVRDTGIGIKKEDLEIIFERFRQVEDYLTRKRKGSGLGLSITKALVELMGGEIRVESEPGKGTTFFFDLPYRPAKSKRTKRSNRSNLNYNLEGVRAAVVEDDYHSGLAIVKMLKKAGAEPEHFEKAEDFFESIESGLRFDVLFLDINLPGMNGFEAARKLKAERPEIPILAQTAFAMETERKAAFEAGCDDYLSKPIVFEDLIEKTAKLLKL